MQYQVPISEGCRVRTPKLDMAQDGAQIGGPVSNLETDRRPSHSHYFAAKAQNRVEVKHELTNKSFV